MSRNLTILINGERKDVEVLERESERVRFRIGNREYLVECAEDVVVPSGGTLPRTVKTNLPSNVGKNGQILAALPGVVVEVLVEVGQVLVGGEVLLRLEAMKMQNNVFAPTQGGTVTAVLVSAGEEVSDGQVLVELLPNTSI